MCNICGRPGWVNCSCSIPYFQPRPFCGTGGVLQLDFSNVIYHKDNNQISNLPNLGLNNGATLQLFAETVDTYIGQIKVSNWILTYLRGKYTINTVQQFAQAVDTQLSIGFLGNLTVDPVSPIDGQLWYNTTSNTLKIAVNGGTIKTITTT